MFIRVHPWLNLFFLMNQTRRQFIRSAAAVTLGFGGLQGCVIQGGGKSGASMAKGYGKLKADPDEILDLPEGFSYRVVSRKGRSLLPVTPWPMTTMSFEFSTP